MKTGLVLICRCCGVISLPQDRSHPQVLIGKPIMRANLLISIHRPMMLLAIVLLSPAVHGKSESIFRSLRLSEEHTYGIETVGEWQSPVAQFGRCEILPESEGPDDSAEDRESPPLTPASLRLLVLEGGYTPARGPVGVPLYILFHCWRHLTA